MKEQFGIDKIVSITFKTMIKLPLITYINWLKYNFEVAIMNLCL